MPNYTVKAERRSPETFDAAHDFAAREYVFERYARDRDVDDDRQLCILDADGRDIDAPDPLDDICFALGPGRAVQLRASTEQSALEHAAASTVRNEVRSTDDARRLDVGVLARHANQHQPAIDAFARVAAGEVRRIEDERDRAERELHDLTALRDKLERDYDACVPADRAGREELSFFVVELDDDIQRDICTIRRLVAREQEIIEHGQHPDQWLQTHGASAVQWGRVQRALAEKAAIAPQPPARPPSAP